MAGVLSEVVIPIWKSNKLCAQLVCEFVERISGVSVFMLSRDINGGMKHVV